MPTALDRVQVLLQPDEYAELSMLAKADRRSLAAMGAVLINEAIKARIREGTFTPSADDPTYASAKRRQVDRMLGKTVAESKQEEIDAKVRQITETVFKRGSETDVDAVQAKVEQLTQGMDERVLHQVNLELLKVIEEKEKEALKAIKGVQQKKKVDVDDNYNVTLGKDIDMNLVHSDVLYKLIGNQKGLSEQQKLEDEVEALKVLKALDEGKEMEFCEEGKLLPEKGLNVLSTKN